MEQSDKTIETEPKRRLGSIHDKFGRKYVRHTVIASDLLRHYADPVVAKNVDVDHLQEAPNRSISKELKEVIMDASFIARFQDAAAKSEVLIILEHKSSPSPYVALQIGAQAFLSLYVSWTEANYTNAETFDPPVPIMVVLYHGAEDWAEKEVWFQGIFKSLPESIRDLVPQFRVIVINLKSFAYGSLPGRPETRAFVESLKRATDGSFAAQLDSVIGHVHDVRLDKPQTWDFIQSIVTYCSWSTGLTSEQLTKAITSVFKGREGIEMAATIQRGLLQEGIGIGEVKAILALLKNRFGDVPSTISDALSKRTDLTAMESLVVFASQCESLDTFADALK